MNFSLFASPPPTLRDEVAHEDPDKLVTKEGQGHVRRYEGL
jgi:hypothetical protein